MTISIKPTSSGSTIEQDGSTILTVDGSGNITPSSDLYPKVPAFSATLSATQTISSNMTWTKVQFDTEEFDSTSDFDTTTYRFTPSVAGYYQFNGQLRLSGSVNIAWAGLALYKNGSFYRPGSFLTMPSGANGAEKITLSCIEYANGTTDYYELYGFMNASSTLRFDQATGEPYFQAHLVSV